MDKYTKDVIQEVTNRYMEGVMLYPSASERLADKKVNAFRNQARRILASEMFKYAMRRIVDEAKSIILLKSKTPEEVLVNRGVILGLKALESELTTWAPPKGETEDEEV